MTEGILAGGSGGMAVHAALQVAAEIDDPEALVVVILPDGGRSYLSQDLQRRLDDPARLPRARAATSTVGDVLRRKHRRTAACRRSSPSTPHQRVRDAVALLHEHRVSQLPVVSAHDPQAIVGSVGERGLLEHARRATRRCSTPRSSHVMEAPLPAVAAADPVREAVELLVGERQALLVPDDGRPAGIVTRADLLEALAR